MQYINHWPDMAELSLPKLVSQDLYRQLLEPFDNEVSAQECWQETPSTVIILDHTDTIEVLQQNPLWDQIEFALTYTEYTVPLSKGYVLSVTIVNDSGSGIFLVIPPELSHIIQEVNP